MLPTQRAVDRLLEWLVRPSVRRFRRWSFLVTVPVAAVAVSVFGYGHGLLVLAVRLVLWVAVAVVAWRLGGERGDAVRDLLMHPRARALLRAELDVVTVLPRLLFARPVRRAAAGAGYHRGTAGLALGLALTPVLATEAAVLHLLLRGGVVAWVATALHVYAGIWLWGFALGARAYPHRVGARSAVLRNGPLYRARVPLQAIEGAQARTLRISDGSLLIERDGAVLLPSRGRVDVWLELAQPVRVQRPLHEPLVTRRIAVASDEPERLVERLLAPGESRAQDREAALGAFAFLELAGLVRDAGHPA